MSNLSDSLTSLFKKAFQKRKWANHSFFEKLQKYNFIFKNLSESLVFSEQKSEWAICSKNERFAHSLFYHERPERIAHSCSFVMRDLSDSLMVTLLSLVIWANRSQSPIKMSNFWADEQIPNPARITYWVFNVYCLTNHHHRIARTFRNTTTVLVYSIFAGKAVVFLSPLVT